MFRKIFQILLRTINKQMLESILVEMVPVRCSLIYYRVVTISIAFYIMYVVGDNFACPCNLLQGSQSSQASY